MCCVHLRGSLAFEVLLEGKDGRIEGVGNEGEIAVGIGGVLVA